MFVSTLALLQYICCYRASEGVSNSLQISFRKEESVTRGYETLFSVYESVVSKIL